MMQKHPVNKPMRVASLAYFILFLMFVVTKNFFPAKYGGWSDPPIIDFIFLLGIGICFLIMGMVYTYYSWTLNAEDFMEWYSDQQIIGKNWAKRSYSPEWSLWSMRLIGGPVTTIVGIVLIGFMLFEILTFIIKVLSF